MRYGTYFHTDTGKLYVAEENGKLVRLDGGSADEADTLQETDLLKQAKCQLEEYFAGGRKTFDLPFLAEGTVFQKKVWQALLQIPYGETRTYGQIAAAVGSPKGARAVGMACNRNPVMLVIPCHRVIGSNGKLVGFGGGLPMKERLLAVEGVHYKKEKHYV